MSSKFKLFDSDSLKFVHKRVFFSITVFIFLFLISIYRISDIMLFANNISQEKIVSQIKLDIPTFTKDNLPENLSSIEAIKPGSRNL